MQSFSDELLSMLVETGAEVYGWCVLPNHYHLLIATPELPATLHALGKLHGRTAFEWNGEENARGRKVWYRCVERSMRNERHRWATLNYIHNNPVHHGYVQRWQDWPFGSAVEYLDEVGVDRARELWRAYPVLDYGKGWDEAQM
jgi:REP-associated tyrosine transposase